MASETPLDLWRSAVAADPARPFATVYDEATGGRVELSYATFDNWVAKTANMLVDGLGAEPGDRVGLALPLHWQSLVWLLACFSTGTTAVAGAPGTVPDCEIAVADPDRLPAALDTGAREVVGTSLHPLGAPLAECPPAAADYGVEVRGYGDRFAAAAIDPAAPAFEVPGDAAGGTDLLGAEVAAGASSGAELAASARLRSAAWGLASTDRVAIITSGRDSLTALGSRLPLLLGPIAGAVPLVVLPAGDSANLQPRLDMERVTATAGARPGTPALAGSLKPLT
ncbi:TIGR03089 family protein [Streptomonospora wellingtoniae]|uniref:TIGR03089 family protein n=1 Tax=Streptomonospora wellingtoniae TaxID=3075544 RepID=A0ABU2KZG1_9ACTN|nr:TIGR03089 family protein [Streptomonospora sp. DSM 45055]MDT0304552.1 TIGR03089 family protein [Streptomonospora sp. DSM 45055]